MWMYFAIAFKALFCSRSRGESVTCVCFVVCLVFASQIFKVTYISALFGLKIWPFKTTYYKEARSVRFGFPRQNLREWVVARRSNDQPFNVDLPDILVQKDLSNEKKVNSRQPLQNNKWQEVGVLCPCVIMYDRQEFFMWTFEDLKAQCGKTEELLEDIRRGLFGGEQCLFMPTSIPLVTDQDNSFPKHCPLLYMKFTHQHYDRLLAFYIFSRLLFLKGSYNAICTFASCLNWNVCWQCVYSTTL